MIDLIKSHTDRFIKIITLNLKSTFAKKLGDNKKLQEACFNELFLKHFKDLEDVKKKMQEGFHDC